MNDQFIIDHERPDISNPRTREIVERMGISTQAWHKGFLWGVWAGYAAAMLTLGSGVAFVMWIDRL